MFTAEIKENECIGCSRCISVCPVDAIVGTNKFMHTILLDECIGCKLCLNPCPVDCIDIIPIEDKLPIGKDINKIERANKAKLRHQNKLTRLKLDSQRQLPIYKDEMERKVIIKDNIAQALERVKLKKLMLQKNLEES